MRNTIAMPLNFQIESENALLRINLSGEMTYEFLQDASQKILNVVKDQKGPVLLDLSGVTYISEDGLALLVSLYRDAVSRGATIYLEGAKEAVADRIKRCGIDQFLKPRPSH
ncbi:MAG: STAS domain-containing protein [Armatimonadota bacterium]|nr:STAS domain-containing protein [Armatimonadota bacterium]